jgi:hypothetical protein
VPKDESPSSDDADALERAEFERELEAFERSREVKPSRFVDPPDATLVMSQVIFNDYPLIWLGNEHTVFVQFRAGERVTDKPIEVTWTSLDPRVLPIVETFRNGQAQACTLRGATPGVTSIVATTSVGHRAELEIQVVDRSKIEIQWF